MLPAGLESEPPRGTGTEKHHGDSALEQTHLAFWGFEGDDRCLLEECVEAEASGEGGSLVTKGWRVEVEQCLWDIRGEVCKSQGK